MLLRLLIIEGLRKKEEFLVKGEIVIGRNKGDLVLNDMKVSSKHAKISSNSKGLIEIEDLKSSNGTFLNDKKVTKALIRPGDKIRIGKTTMLVREGDKADLTGKFERGSWQEVLDEALAQNLAIFESQPPALKTSGLFNQPFVLDFTHGFQTGTSVVFGFGPRSIGRLGADIVLTEKSAPDLAFELSPISSGLCVLRSSDANIVVNTVKIPVKQTVVLKNGDRICIGPTVIVVRSMSDDQVLK